MGKKGNKGQILGRSIIKERFAKKRPTVGSKGDTFLHTSELQDGYNWGRLNLMSVTEQSNLDDFLATAEMAGTEFTAEKLNVKFIDRQKDSGLPSGEELKRLKDAQERNIKLLRIPRRPKWNSSTSTDELLSRERENFLEWRKSLALLQEDEELTLTPYEKNLEFWRQLWRVIERSDVVIQIVDARNPLLFRCKDLEDYVKEVDTNKVNVILVNKADYLSHEQRKEWAKYFSREGVKVAFWSALWETERQEELSRLQKAAEMVPSPEFPVVGTSDEKPVSENEKPEEEQNVDPERKGETADEKTAKVEEEEDEEEEAAALTISEEPDLKTVLESLSLQPADSEEEDEDDEESEIEELPIGSARSHVPAVGATENQKMNEAVNDNETTLIPVINSAEVFGADRLLEFFKSLHTGPKVREGITTIGMVGYPNVGKSSTINAILRTKKVPVSATPGRTKHFQTLYVEKNLMLCDCPGLVFPSFVSTKAELVINGILPIDQMKDHIPPTSLVCQRIPRQYLEDLYGIIIPRPGECEDPDRPPTALELLNAYGYMRGFMTQSSVPDCPRSARYILKDYMNGKLLFCQAPPGVDTVVFQEVSNIKLKARKKETLAFKKETVSKQEVLDNDFFTMSKKMAHSIGSRGVKGYVRLNGLQQVGCSGEDDDCKKTGKKHHKKKKEKLRRAYAHLDQH